MNFAAAVNFVCYYRYVKKDMLLHALTFSTPSAITHCARNRVFPVNLGMPVEEDRDTNASQEHILLKQRVCCTKVIYYITVNYFTWGTCILGNMHCYVRKK